MRTFFSNKFGSLDKVKCVWVVFFHASCNGQDVEIENNIFRSEVKRLCKQFVSSDTNVNLVLDFCGLTYFIESHYNNTSTVLLDLSCEVKEFFFSILERDRVDNTFSLEVL